MHPVTPLRRQLLLATSGAFGALIAIVLALPAPEASGSKPSHTGGTACANAVLAVSGATTRELRRAVRCLVNVERVARGHSKLSKERSLKRAAQRHSKTMVETGCLEHRCEGERSLRKRLSRAGYFEDAVAWEYAENTGCAATTLGMVASWMRSRVHRDYILDTDFREIGVGVIDEPAGSSCKAEYATFAIVVGWRKLES